MKLNNYSKKLLFIIVFTVAYLAYFSNAQARYGAPRCIEQCFNYHPDWTYCSHGREFGWCCPN